MQCFLSRTATCPAIAWAAGSARFALASLWPRRAARQRGRSARAEEAAPRADREARHLPLHVGRAEPRRHVRPQARADAAARPEAAGVVRDGQDAPRRGQEQAPRLEADVQEVRPGGIEVSDWFPHIGQRHRRHLRPARLLRRQRHAPGVGVPDEHRLDPDGPAEPGRVGELRPRHREPEHAGVRRHARPRRLAEGRLARVGQRLPARPRIRARSFAAASRRSCICPTRPACRTRSSGARSTSSPSSIASTWPRAARIRNSPRASRPTNSPSACRRTRRKSSIWRRRPRRRRSSTAWIARRPPSSARAACSRGGWSSAACASCRSTRGDTNGWDGHSDLEGNHSKLCARQRQADRRAADRSQASRAARRTRSSSGAASSAARR